MIAGVEQKAHFQCFDLPYSDDRFVIALPAKSTEAFLEGHNQAFAYFTGVPNTILYDNMRIAVKEIPGDGERKPAEASVDCYRTICLRPSSNVPERATTRATWKGWWGMRATTSWCRYRAQPVGRN